MFSIVTRDNLLAGVFSQLPSNVLLSQTVADAAQQITKVIGEAKPIAASTVETISSGDPVLIVGSAGALFVAYLFLPPIWSVISFSLRGYKGDFVVPDAVLYKQIQFGRIQI